MDQKLPPKKKAKSKAGDQDEIFEDKSSKYGNSVLDELQTANFELLAGSKNGNEVIMNKKSIHRSTILYVSMIWLGIGIRLCCLM